MSDDDARDPVGRKVDEDFGDRIRGRRLGSPWRGDDFQPLPHLVHTRAVENRNVLRAFGGKQRTGVHRRRIERVVVARQQVHRNADGAHGFQRLTDVARRELVVFEDIACDDDEFGARVKGQRPDACDDVAAGGRIPPAVPRR